MAKVAMAQVQDLIACLQGTCMDFGEACADLGFSENDLTLDQLQEVDNWIFYCPNCGWWCDRAEGHDVDGEEVCTDCYEDMNDDF